MRNSENIPLTFPVGMTADKWSAYKKYMIDVFSKIEYGYTPQSPKETRAEVITNTIDFYSEWTGKADHKIIRLSFDTPKGEYSFRCDTTIPRIEGKKPFIVYIAFTKYPHGGFCPMEEIIDRGYAIASFYYEDVVNDENYSISGGIADMYPRIDSNGASWGKIGMWAFAASRVMDYLQTLPEADKNRIYVMGHSRLGKTALWCAAQDERFAGVVSNDSGCNGTAITRGKIGENIADSVRVFPYWYCENYANYAGKEYDLPIDQHQLLSLIAPRLLCVGSAKEDNWADPESEYLSVKLASEAFALLGQSGLVDATDELSQSGTHLLAGNPGYQIRAGSHFLGREDWNTYLDFLDLHKPE